MTVTQETLQAGLGKTLEGTNFESLGTKYEGKVRDCYISDGKRYIVVTDRISAFDRVLGTLPYEVVKDRLPSPADEIFWLAIRENLTRFDDMTGWHRVCYGEIESVIAEEDRAFLAEAAKLLPPEPWGETTWKTWTTAVKEATGRKGKALFKPLRLALTARDSGPDLAVLMPLLSKGTVRRRLGVT